jgi:hypothetical protein
MVAASAALRVLLKQLNAYALDENVIPEQIKKTFSVTMCL